MGGGGKKRDKTVVINQPKKDIGKGEAAWRKAANALYTSW
jgi:uncharacterized protein (UPF0548 family)